MTNPTTTRKGVHVDPERIASFCRKHHIRRLSLFGSVIRDGLGPDSDIDVLVEFAPGSRVGYIRLARIEDELSGIMGHKVDMRTPAELSRYFRDDVLRSAEVQYAEG